jgi:hypothetical protein
VEYGVDFDDSWGTGLIAAMGSAVEAEVLGTF